jgi:FlaA1/EpsC-like NDP-sugar epimerase
LAFPSATGKVVREALSRCQAAGVKALIMPDMANALGDEVFQPRPVDIRDLLKRSPKEVDQTEIGAFFSGKTVLVTGAGGSIGSEICRQVLRYGPRHLLVLDASEFSLYQIDEELRPRKGPRTEIHALLGSITDSRFIETVMRRFCPDYVLHAAAYKHVPLVEINPLQGIYNNLEGTRVLAEMAQRFAVKKFLLISTDKAVRPTNVMGATKRCCELLIQTLHGQADSRTAFCAVRFGNVLGSSGSVVPKFLQQIQSGGPVTVTHPDITRYFMLTSEAVGLVLQSITMSRGGETFVLDMGEPVRVADMAHQLIQLAGKTPEKDIEVIYSGLRPGEKLYEELILEGAEERTLHENIFVMRPRAIENGRVRAALDDLLDVTKQGQESSAIKLVKELASDPAGWDDQRTIDANNLS